MKKLAIFRLLGLLLAIGGIAIAVHYGRLAVQARNEVAHAEVARPMRMQVDLSQPGQYKADFMQTYASSHGELICIEVDTTEKLDDPGQYFEGLSGDIVITDAAGNEIAGRPVDRNTIHYFFDNLVLARLGGFEKGHYTATLHVYSGALQRADENHTLYAMYELCGMEMIPAMVATIIASVAGIVAAVLLLLTLPGVIKYGLWRKNR